VPTRTLSLGALSRILLFQWAEDRLLATKELKLAKQKIYVDPTGAGGRSFSGDFGLYTSAARALAKQHAALAGARLAAVLNAELKRGGVERVYSISR
jgi:hypothetical protein